MRFARLGAPGSEIPVVHTDSGTFDLRALTADIDGGFLGGDGLGRAAEEVSAGTLTEINPTGVRVGSPIARPGRIVCVARDAAVGQRRTAPGRLHGDHDLRRRGDCGSGTAAAATSHESSGTPAGVALGMPDQPYLRGGDVVELEIDGLGRARQEMKQA
ncbi:hypothetical protein GCM10025773_29100 [Microbacterium jejuense]